MYCYRDMTFCDFKDCRDYKTCFRKLTDEHIAKAQMAGMPIAKFISQDDCECFKKKEEDNNNE